MTKSFKCLPKILSRPLPYSVKCRCFDCVWFLILTFKFPYGFHSDFHPSVNHHLEIIIITSFSSILCCWLATSGLTKFRYAQDGNIFAFADAKSNNKPQSSIKYFALDNQNVCRNITYSQRWQHWTFLKKKMKYFSPYYRQSTYFMVKTKLTLWHRIVNLM
jgi:hypothetical protein